VVLSVTPLIDVLFLLIIFFTLTSTFKRVGELELRLPDSSTAEANQVEEPAGLVELIVMENGELILDGETVAFEDLRARLEADRAANPEGRVMIKAESAVEHGEVVRLLDAVREAGFSGVGIGTHVRGIAETP
jgi:biopolymer transport protein ExbD